jgi:hypothetical protein
VLFTNKRPILDDKTNSHNNSSSNGRPFFPEAYFLMHDLTKNAMKIGIMLFLMIIGFVIVALPDADERLFSMSQAHGPSGMDAAGLIILLIGYAGIINEAWKNRARIIRYQQSTYFKAGLFLLGAGLGLIIASVMNDYKYWWVFGIAILVFIQSAFFYISLKQ